MILVGDPRSSLVALCVCVCLSFGLGVPDTTPTKNTERKKAIHTHRRTTPNHSMRRAVLTITALLVACAAADRIAILSHHNPKHWSDDACTSTHAAMAACNLRVYKAAIAPAVANNQYKNSSSGGGGGGNDMAARADLILLPEAYGLTGPGVGSSEVYVSSVGAIPCDNASAAALAPAQQSMSCAALRDNVTVVANFFVTLPNASLRIVEVAYEAATGAVAASYFKHHLFPNEKAEHISPGPFAPTTFVAPRSGKRWGDHLLRGPVRAAPPRLVAARRHQGRRRRRRPLEHRQLAPDKEVGRSIARHVGLPVLASEDGAAARALGADGGELPLSASTPLAVANYTGDASVDVFEVLF